MGGWGRTDRAGERARRRHAAGWRPAPTSGATAAGGAGGTAGGTGGGASSPARGGTAGGGPSPPSTQPVATIRSVRIDGARSGLEPGDRLTLAASGLGAGGAAVSGGTPRWTTSDASIGTVTAEGLFTAVGPGSVTVTAVIDGVPGSSTIDVVPASVVTLAVLPTSLSLAPGEASTLAAQARGRSGEVVQAGVTWRSSAPGVATVSSGGAVEAVAPGTATITASAGGVSETVAVTVTAPVVDTRTAVTDLIAAFARALESRDINEVRRAYPGMTQEQQRNFSGAIASLQSATLAVNSVEENGDVATAAVSGQYVFVEDGRRLSSPVSFRAIFERTGGTWRMTGMQ
jgi:hypothetical protein